MPSGPVARCLWADRINRASLRQFEHDFACHTFHDFEHFCNNHFCKFVAECELFQCTSLLTTHICTDCNSHASLVTLFSLGHCAVTQHMKVTFYRLCSYACCLIAWKLVFCLLLYKRTCQPFKSNLFSRSSWATLHEKKLQWRRNYPKG